MAATNIDPQAAKEAKQKKILIAASVVLLALLAWQLPKYLGGSPTPAAAPTTTTTGTPDASGAVTPTPTPTAGVPTATPTSLVAASVGAKPKADEAQLASFSLFKPKDPFVQKIVDAAAQPTKPADAGTKTDGGGGTTPAPGGVTAPASKPAPAVYG